MTASSVPAMGLDEVPHVADAHAAAQDCLHALDVDRYTGADAAFDDGVAGVAIAAELLRHRVEGEGRGDLPRPGFMRVLAVIVAVSSRYVLARRSPA